MSLILRVDVDKPYGSSNLLQKIMSKLREDYWFPVINDLGYLRSVEHFLMFCTSNNIRAMMHFRNCTLPNQKILRLLDEGRHTIGFHAENTRSFFSFSEELSFFRTQVPGRSVSTFTKHGSGYYKLGKHHFPNYEPEKYQAWSKKCHIKFPFGNGIASSKDDFNDPAFFPNVFWIERPYRSLDFQTLEQVIEIAKHNIVPVLIHPENFCSTKDVREDFKTLIRLSKARHIDWVLPYD